MNDSQPNDLPLEVRPILEEDEGVFHPCPYLPGRLARMTGGQLEPGRFLSPALHEQLLWRNYRRSGSIIYRPRCHGCQACRSLRVRVEDFYLTRSLKRIRRRNEDLRVVATDRLDPTREKYDLYRRYLRDQHDGAMSDDWESFTAFLHESPTVTVEFGYYLFNRLVAVSVADRLPSGLSSVYVYFDPDYRDRSLGTYSGIWEIEYSRRVGLPYYYLGYYVEGCDKMTYKARFRPCETLDDDMKWTPFRD